jgi:septal ring factor EnvC (AmiA/AmiB activator)
MPIRVTSPNSLIRSLCLLSLFLLLPPESPHARQASESDIRKDQINRIETDLSREKKQFLKFGEKEKSLLGQLSGLEKQMAGKRTVLDELKKNIDQSRKELKREKRRLREQDRVLKEVEDRLAQRLLAFYKYAKRGYIQLFATSSGLNQLRKRVKYLSVIMKGDRGLLREMADIHKSHRKAVSSMREKLALIDQMKKTEGERLASLKKDLDEKVLLLMKIHKEKEFYETAVEELQFAAQNLKDTLINLEKVPKRETQKKEPPDGLEKSKGKLPLPFKGKIVKDVSPFGSAVANNQKGIYIEGPSGAEINAIFSGRVDYSGWLKGYGQIIVINHGSRFFSVSAHLSERYMEEGDMVEKGEVVGLLGDSESLAGPRLYFEMRRGGVPLDPLKWLKVH